MDKDWVVLQLRSGMNLFGVFGLWGIILYTVFFYGSAYYFDWATPVLFGVYFLIAAWSMLATMIIFSIVVGGLVALFPFLAPIAFVLMVILFFMRIQYILTNWRPILAGIAFYGFVYMFYEDPGRIFWLSRFFWTSISDFQPVSFWGQYLGVLLQNFILGLDTICPVIILQVVLCWLYRRGYSSSAALSIMGSIPLVILAMILPFLKVMGADAIVGDTHAGNIGTHEGMVHDAHVQAPGYHQVHGYDRVAADGHIEHVNSYIRSNPDGILENNLSYHGGSQEHFLAVSDRAEHNAVLRGLQMPFVASWYFAKRNGPAGLIVRGRDLLAVFEMGALLAALFSLVYTTYGFAC